MTAAESCLREAAAKADAWAEKAEASGRLGDAASLCVLASSAKEKADALAVAEASRPPALRGDSAPDPSTACALCGSPGIRKSAGLLLACSNPGCLRYGAPVAATVF